MKEVDFSAREKVTKYLQDLAGEIKQQEFVITEENLKQEKYHVK